MSRIFKQGSLEQELLEGMETAQLERVAEEEGHQEQIVIQAMEHLNAAAQVFERAGSGTRAKEVTQVMMSLAKKDKKDKKDSDSKPKSKKSSSKDEAKKVFRFFGFSPEYLGSDFSSGGDGGDGE